MSRPIVALLLLGVTSSASADDVAPEVSRARVDLRQTSPVPSYQPFVLTTTAPTLGLGHVAVEMGGGYDGLRPPEEEEEEEEEEGIVDLNGTQRSAVWWEAGVGVGGGVEIVGAAQIGDYAGRYGLTLGRAEARVELVPASLDVPVQAAVGVGWQVDVLDEHAITASAAISGTTGRVLMNADVRFAHVFADDREHCLDAGMNEVITKPFQPEALFATLLKALS